MQLKQLELRMPKPFADDVKEIGLNTLVQCPECEDEGRLFRPTRRNIRLIHCDTCKGACMVRCDRWCDYIDAKIAGIHRERDDLQSLVESRGFSRSRFLEISYDV